MTILLSISDAISAGLDFEAALQDPEMVKLQASQQVSHPCPCLPARTFYSLETAFCLISRLTHRLM